LGPGWRIPRGTGLIRDPGELIAQNNVRPSTAFYDGNDLVSREAVSVVENNGIAPMRPVQGLDRPDSA
jgi:hypothetical protein